MKQAVKAFMVDTLRQLFGIQKPSTGKLILTHHAFTKMREYQLDTDTLHDVFEYGEQRTEQLIIRKYAAFEVGMFIKKDETKWGTADQYVIVTCWKR